MSNSTVAFFGATGGCAGWALASALSNGQTCRALARSPEKLIKVLLEKNVSQIAIDKHLTIVAGNAKSVDDVTKVLSTNNGSNVVDGIVFGIGATPVLRLHYMPVTLDDPSVCRTATATILAALRSLTPTNKSGRKPYLVAVSTTGITSGPRDVPLLFVPLYHWMLAVPHVDKYAMESLIRDEGEKGEVESVLGGYVVVRASLLTDGLGMGVGGLRVGREREPAVGYTVSRRDVGAWIWESVVREGGTGKWSGEAITVTY